MVGGGATTSTTSAPADPVDWSAVPPGAPDGSGSTGTGPGSGSATAPDAPRGSGATADATSAGTATQLRGLVRIETMMAYAGSQAAGTGMVLSSDGEVVTNPHVVEGAIAVEVTVMSTGRTQSARVVGTDASADVVLLRLSGAAGLSTGRTDDDGVSLGDAVTAVGDAGGDEDTFSASTGTMTALRHFITTRSGGAAAGDRLTGLMQIGSDVVPGNSGGATYDDEGEVVATTTAASTGPSGIDGYAFPVATVLRIVEDLHNGVTGDDDYARPAFLGVGLAG